MQIDSENAEDMVSIVAATELLNDFNRLLADKPRTLDTTIAASSILLVQALRQIGGDHGQERTRHIAQTLQEMVNTAGLSEQQIYDRLLRQQEVKQ